MDPVKDLTPEEIDHYSPIVERYKEWKDENCDATCPRGKCERCENMPTEAEIKVIKQHWIIASV